jgi:hypothetical protein
MGKIAVSQGAAENNGENPGNEMPVVFGPQETYRERQQTLDLRVPAELAGNMFEVDHG